MAAKMVKALEVEARLSELSEASVCVLIGGDDALRAHCLRLLKSALAPADLPGSSVRVFEGPADAGDVFEELRTIPFMGLPGRRAVVVASGDAFLQAHWDKLLHYLKRPSSTGRLVLCVSQLDAKRPPGRQGDEGPAEAERATAWRDLLATIGIQGAMIDCARLSWRDARAWAGAYAERCGGKLTRGATDALVEAVGPNLLALRNEVDKLSTHVGPKATVTERDVSELVPQARSRSAFDLGEAVGRADVAEALRLCGRLLLQGESREGIVAVLALQLRRLWQIKRLQAAGADEREIIRRSDAPAFAVRRALKAVGSLPEGRFARQIVLLSAADAESKTASVRSQEEGVWLESLLARLCSA